MIKTYRKKSGLTQKQFSELFGIPIDVVKSWDSGRRNPPAWAENMIIKELEKECSKMNKTYSEYYDMACVDIGNNGYNVLKRKKYTDIIKTTVIKRFKNGLGNMVWKDKNGLVIAHHTGTIDSDYYPYVGEIIEEYETEQ